MCVYLGAAILLTYPLVHHARTDVVSHWDDVEHSLWVTWWFGKAMDTPGLKLFSTNMINYPLKIDLRLGDLNVAILAPLYLLHKLCSLALTYNISIWLSFLLSAGLMWYWTARVSGSGWAGWVAGLLYAGSAYWLSCMINGWLYLVHIWVFPLTLLAWRNMIRRKTAAGAVLAGAAWGLSFHVSPYYFLYLMALMACLAPWHVREFIGRDRWKGNTALLGLAFLVTALAVLPCALPLALAPQKEVLVHHHALNTELSASLAEMFAPSQAGVAARTGRIGYGIVYLGYTTLALLVVSCLDRSRGRRCAPWLISAVLLAVLALGPLVKVGYLPPYATWRMPLYWINHLRGFNLMTNHWRWMLPAVFCMLTAAAIGLGDLLRSAAVRARARPALIVALVAAAYAAEMSTAYPLPLYKPLWPVAPCPAAYALKEIPDVRAVWDPGPHSKLNQIVHEKAITNGWLPRAPAAEYRWSHSFAKKIRRICDREELALYLKRHLFDAAILNPKMVLVFRGQPGSEPGLVIETVRADGIRRIVP